MKKILSLALSTGTSYSVIIFGLAAAFLISCTKAPKDPSSGLTGGESPIKVTLNAGTFAGTSVDGGDMDEQTTTKALPTGMNEDDMANIWVVQFNTNGACVKSQYFASYDPSNFVVTLANGTAQTVAFVANTFDPNLFKDYAKTWTDFQSQSKTITESGIYTGSGADKYLIITGTFKGNITTAGLPAAVQMKRAVAKVNFTWSTAVPATDLFTVKSIRVCRVPNKQTPIEPTSNTYPAWTAVNDSILYPEVTNPAAGTHTWYITENARGTGTGSTTFDKNNHTAPAGQAAYCTYINVQGDYTFDNSGANSAKKQTVSLSYKFYLGANMTSDYNVRRNNIYNLTIRITGANAADARITVISGGGNYSINEGWDNPGSQDAPFGPGGPSQPAPAANCYMMASGQTLTYDAKIQGNGGAGAAAMNPASVGILWQTGNGVTPLIKSVSMNPTNKHVTIQTSNAFTAGNAVVAAYSGANGTGTILWSWHIWVTDYKPVGQTAVAQNTAYTVTGGQVHTYGTNFMAKNPGKVIMDRNLGATAATYAPPADVAAAAKTFGMFYQWGRKDPLPQWDGVGSSDATAKTIPIYAANGTTLLVEGAKDDATAAGYKKVSVATAGSTPPATLGYATKNPLTFIYNGSTPYDWYTSTNNNSAQNNGLWGDGTQKSGYDPCPAGWRIAPNGTWSDFGTNVYAAPFYYYINGVKQTASGTPAFVQSGRNGRFYEAGAVKAWYPAPGFRNVTAGALASVGHYGFSWSSTVSDIYGMDLYFHYGGLNPSTRDYRANGYQVRCLQE